LQQSNGNPLQTKYKARRGGLNPTNAVSRISVAILGVFLDPVYYRRQNSTNHAVQKNVVARRDFYFRSARIVIVTRMSANEKESAGRLGSPGLPDLRF